MPAHPNSRPPAAAVRATADDWPDLRDLRLAALADSPRAFGSTLERERAYDEGDWREWLRTSAVFYRRHGFTGTGTSKPLPSSPAISEEQLVLQLG